MQTLKKPSPALRERLERLEGCRGHWLLIRDGEPEQDCSYQWYRSPTKHLQTCLLERWRGVSLGFVPSLCGYSDYSSTGLVGLSNYNVLTDPSTTPDPHGGILECGYGWNGRGVVLDVLRITADVLETVEALESYPLISEDDHSQLECDVIENAWGRESVAERVRILQDLDLCIFAARRDSAPWELEQLRESLLEVANQYPTSAV